MIIASVYSGVKVSLAKCLKCLKCESVVGAFNQEKAIVGAFSVIVKIQTC